MPTFRANHKRALAESARFAYSAPDTSAYADGRVVLMASANIAQNGREGWLGTTAPSCIPTHDTRMIWASSYLEPRSPASFHQGWHLPAEGTSP